MYTAISFKSSSTADVLSGAQFMLTTSPPIVTDDMLRSPSNHSDKLFSFDPFYLNWHSINAKLKNECYMLISSNISKRVAASKQWAAASLMLWIH